MKVLILTQYYLPENPPGAHRLSSLAKVLASKGVSVEVLTAFPNYPNQEVFGGYKIKWHHEEIMDGIKVHRSYVYLGKKRSIANRLFAYLSFQFSSLYNGLTRIQKPDVIICLSPPIFTCFTAVALKKRYKSTLILNIADLWPESGVKLGILKNKMLINIAERVEKYFYRSSKGIACQTQGILKNIESRVPGKKMFWFRNGVDFESLKRDMAKQVDQEIIRDSDYSPKDIVVAYTGLVGYAQGLEVIVNAANHRDLNPDVKFLIVGDGPKLLEIQALASSFGLTNIRFTGNLPKFMMPSVLRKVTATIVPLRKNDLFLGALPSKIFDSFALKIPVILGVAGEAKELFCDTYNCAFYYEPDNSEELVKVLNRIASNRDLVREFGDRGYRVMEEDFNRDKIGVDVLNFISEVHNSDK